MPVSEVQVNSNWSFHTNQQEETSMHLCEGFLET